jgi:hypothetical protein
LKTRLHRGLAVASAAVIINMTLFLSLNSYHLERDPDVSSISDRIDEAPGGTAVLQMIPNAVVPYFDLQKRALPELGWIEEQYANPIVLSRIQALAERHLDIWVITEAPAKTGVNNVEAAISRSLIQVAQEAIGRFRLLRFRTEPAQMAFTEIGQRFEKGIIMRRIAVDNEASGTGGNILNLTIEWQAASEPIDRPDYTVFAHLVTENGVLIAQHDDQPSNGLIPTSSWSPGQIVYDHHSIRLPLNAPSGQQQLRLGLYDPSNGRRLAVTDEAGNDAEDLVVLNVGSNTVLR